MKSTFCFLLLLSLLSICVATCPTDCKCPSTEIVICSKAKLTAIPKLPPSTTSLDISSNLISSLPAEAFVSAPKLRFLNLNNNRLTSISPDAFSGLSNLQNLSLANNALRDTFNPESICSNSVLDINLANNLLTKIPALKSTSLTRLTLSSNTIRSAVFPDTFSDCPNLQSILLSGNQIATIGANDLDSLTPVSVTSLNFDANRITSIDPKAVAAVGISLKNLNINRNRLTTEALASALKGYQQVVSVALLSLSVSFNAISKLDSSVFEPLGYTMFRSLELNGHRMLQLDPNAFQSLKKSMKILSIRDCGLSSIPDAVSSLSLDTLRLDGNSFAQLPSNLPANLVELSITRTGLQGWTEDALSRLSKLKRLDLSKNSLEIITKNETNALHQATDRLKMLGLVDNPFNCSCDIAWFSQWGASKEGEAVQDFKRLKCASPDQVDGNFLKDVDMSKCIDNDDASDSDSDADEYPKKRTNEDSRKNSSKNKHHHKKSNSRKQPSEAKHHHHHHKKSNKHSQKEPSQAKHHHHHKKSHHNHHHREL